MLTKKIADPGNENCVKFVGRRQEALDFGSAQPCFPPSAQSPLTENALSLRTRLCVRRKVYQVAFYLVQSSHQSFFTSGLFSVLSVNLFFAFSTIYSDSFYPSTYAHITAYNMVSRLNLQ